MRIYVNVTKVDKKQTEWEEQKQLKCRWIMDYSRFRAMKYYIKCYSERLTSAWRNAE